VEVATTAAGLGGVSVDREGDFFMGDDIAGAAIGEDDQLEAALRQSELEYWQSLAAANNRGGS
jgi:hypothetical protein